MNTSTTVEEANTLEGLLSLIDAAQDYAVDEMGLDPMHVFDFEQEDGECTFEFTSRCEEPASTTKKVFVCELCNSDNVRTKGWVNPNQDFQYDTDTGEEMGWCEDEELSSNIISTELKADAKVIGFQIVGEQGTVNEGKIHPDMDASFCLYNLSWCRARLHEYCDWRLLTVWEGDVEEPTMMFEGNPRD
jgi:hypothetical protein